MNDYTIWCTEEQTRKALELGAPIEVSSRVEPIVNRKYTIDLSNYTAIIIPTTEQMIGWLEEQNIAIDLHTYFKVNNSRINHYEYTVTDSTRVFNGSKITRKEAVIAAIDKALEYLTNNKK